GLRSGASPCLLTTLLCDAPVPASVGTLSPWRPDSIGVRRRTGGVAERSNAAVLKTAVPQGTGGSNPSPSARTPPQRGDGTAGAGGRGEAAAWGTAAACAP